MSATSFRIGPFTGRAHVRDGVKSGSWQLDVPQRFSPTRKRQRLSFKSKGEAEAEARRLNRELQLKGRLPDSALVHAGTRFVDLVEMWLEFQQARVATGKKRQNSLETNAYQLKPLLEHFGGALASLISADGVLGYQKWRRENKRSARTINSETATLRQILLWAQQRDLVRNVPIIEPIPHFVPSLELPTPAEVMRIIANMAKDETAVLIRTIAETGLRKGELFSLRWNDVDRSRNALVVRDHEGFTPKTASSRRSVLVTSDLIAAINQLPRKNELVFPGRSGARKTSVAKALATAVKKADVTREGAPMRLTLHMLRKAHATWHAEQGTPQVVLQDRLGHTRGSRVTQQVYIHASENAQKRAAALSLQAMAEQAASDRDLATSGNNGS